MSSLTKCVSEWKFDSEEANPKSKDRTQALDKYNKLKYDKNKTFHKFHI